MLLKRELDEMSKSHRKKTPMCPIDIFGCGEGKEDDGRLVWLVQGWFWIPRLGCGEQASNPSSPFTPPSAILVLASSYSHSAIRASDQCSVPPRNSDWVGWDLSAVSIPEKL